MEKHHLVDGGEVTYFMTDPKGERSLSWWWVTSVDPPRWLEFTDGWANPDGLPNKELPTTSVQVRLS